MSRHLAARKSAALYNWVIAIWLPMTAAAVYTSWATVAGAWHRAAWLGALVAVCEPFIAYFWLNGTKDVVYTLFYHVYVKHHPAQLPLRHLRTGIDQRVVMVYCTCDDFNAASLTACLRQSYANHWVVILDDSKQPTYQAAVDAYALEHGIEVVRRTSREGAKAGNLNHYLRTNDQWDYFVILDSDEIIPRSAMARFLDYFMSAPDVGIVQGNHRATRNRNRFMKRFAPGVDSHWIAYQTVKDRYGFMSLLGHGAMVSRQCYEAVGGFPHVVAEDICLSIEARDAGFRTVFAPDVMCEEEFPVDYLAFKKRHAKWTEGNMEFIRRYTRKIFGSDMTWYEKLDIVLFTYSLPLTALFTVYVVINVFALPLANYQARYPLWMLAPTGVFLVAPMLNDIIFYFKKMGKRELVGYLLRSTVLFGSMFYVSLRSSVKAAFGKSVFHTTPKEDRRVTFRQAVVSHKWELCFGIMLSVGATIVNASVLPVVLIAWPAILSIVLIAVHHDHQQEEPTTE